MVIGCTGSINEPQNQNGSGGSNQNGSGGSNQNGSGGSNQNGSGGSNQSGSGGSTPGSGGAIGFGSGGTTGACTSGVAVTSQIARLTNAQYDATIQNLLGVTGLMASNNSAPSDILATDQGGGLTAIGWSSYMTVADMVSAQVMADANLKKNFLKCTPTGDGKACLHDTIIQFGRRAFRRPLSDAEIAAFDKIVADGPKITAAGTTDQIAQTLLYMFLISPSFLQRGEISGTADSNGRVNLSSYEVASRLSYMLWDSSPDDTLDQAANKGELTTTQQIMTQAQRMVKMDKARAKVSAFHRQYMLMGTNTHWDNVNHDTAMFSTFTKAIIPTLQAETEQFFDQMVFQKNASFQDFLTSPVAYVNSQTAPLYGLKASDYTANAFKETTLDPVQRPGFLTRVGFLNAYSAYNRTNPIQRGQFITKQILGANIPPPPADAAMAMLPTGANLDTNRKQVDEQTKGAMCVGCHHTFINPPGFVLEAFNAVGTWQTQEASTKAPIDMTAELNIDGKSVKVNNPQEMMKAIAASTSAQGRYAGKWIGYAYEREGDTNDSCTLKDLSDKINAGSYPVLTLLTDLTQTQQFRTRAVGVTQ
jgi:hypothetical protein